MKKVLQVLGFALVAMVLFAGCGKKDKWKDVDQPVTEITFSDGSWEGEYYMSMDYMGVSMEEDFVIEFDVANGKCTATGGYMKVEANGQSSGKQELTAAELAGLKDQPTSTFLSYLGMEVGGLPPASEFKTNEDKTKYRYFEEDDAGEIEVTFVKQ